MRIGQLARKFDLSTQDIIDTLNKASPASSFHPNTKLSDDQETYVIDSLGLVLMDLDEDKEPEPVAVDEDDQQLMSTEESSQPVKKDDTAQLESIDSLVEEVVDDEQAENENEEVVKAVDQHIDPEVEQDDGAEIYSDKLLALLEAEDSEVDLTKITRIKAPKRDLEGLKVVGKIELPEPKQKTTKAETEQEEEPEVRYYKKPRRPKLTEEQLEERRLRAKKKKAAHEARLEKSRKEKAFRDQKKRKKAHYEEQIKTAPSHSAKKKGKSNPSHTSTSKSLSKSKDKPKTVFGKFWRWLNPEE